MLVPIVLFLIVFFIYLFISDKNEAIKKNINGGGLATKFPNFIIYTTQAYTTDKPKLKFVKDDGRYLEYRFSIGGTKPVVSYYYIGIEKVFSANAYVFAITSRGKKINGYFKEIHNGSSNSRMDRTVDEYNEIFESLIWQMEHSKDFELNFYGYVIQ